MKKSTSKLNNAQFNLKAMCNCPSINCSCLSTYPTSYGTFKDNLSDHYQHDNKANERNGFQHAIEDEFSYSISYPSVSSMPNQQHDGYSTSSYSLPSGDYFHPEEIFQLDQPIRSTYNSYSPHNMINEPTLISNSRSPSTSTLLDMESGTIQKNNSNIMNKAWINDVKYESCDDTSSLTSTSSQFDEAYYTFQTNNNNYLDSNQYGNSEYNMNVTKMECAVAFEQNQFFDHCENIAGDQTLTTATHMQQYYYNENQKTEDYNYQSTNNLNEINNTPNGYDVWNNAPQQHHNDIHNNMHQTYNVVASNEFQAYNNSTTGQQLVYSA